MIVIGVTGGLGTGKSTVARLFRELGAEVLDADRAVHRLLEPGQPVWKKIRSGFGPSVLEPDGRINRKRLGEIVFRSPARLKALNRIVHPAVRRQLLADLGRLKRRRPRGVAVLDIPLLIESGRAYRVDAVVVVTASAAAAARRLKARSGWSAAQIKQRSGFQMPLREKVKHADFVVKNGGSLADTRRQVVHVWKKITGEGVHG
ncbi:MAG: dephospho-CoA kinase [Candidatus Omnitrophota bacterium]|nr:dephospho-CoA kinase [Candidatus Omnitrophota bacterium]